LKEQIVSARKAKADDIVIVELDGKKVRLKKDQVAEFIRKLRELGDA
jgi:hypothetical protein